MKKSVLREIAGGRARWKGKEGEREGARTEGERMDRSSVAV